MPPGYRNAAAAPPKAGTAATCSVNNEPDPLVLNSFDWVYLDRGYINATADPERGCLFVVSGWYLESRSARTPPCRWGCVRPVVRLRHRRWRPAVPAVAGGR
ncbi:hypothetical protein EF879_22425 [Micromonospora sp. HM5-17]|nr:hypothetical protein EF879_22425 [Micromonospora sp. HM5-17]